MTNEMTRRRFVKVGGALVGVVALGGAGAVAATRAPEVPQQAERMGDGMSKVLVVYGTGTGCTKGVAERIGAALGSRGATADVVSVKDSPDPSSYDAVVAGSGVRGGQWHAPVRTWVSQNAAALKSKPVSFYTVCLTLAQDPGKTDEVRAYTDALIAESGVKPADIGLFAGWNEPQSFPFLERMILKAMKAPVGDFRDWKAIDAWAGASAKTLGVAS